MEAIRHSYNLRPKRVPNPDETKRKEIFPPTITVTAGMESGRQPTGKNRVRIPTHVLDTDAESAEDEDEVLENQSGQSEGESDRSSPWIDSRSRATSPASSVPSSSRRRSSVEDREVSHPAGITVHPRSLGQLPSQGGGSKEAPGCRNGSNPAPEIESPEELAMRSTQLIAQLQRFIQEREEVLASPRNEPGICGDCPDPREAESRRGGRHRPVASQPSEVALAQPGARDHFSNNTLSPTQRISPLYSHHAPGRKTSIQIGDIYLHNQKEYANENHSN